MTPVTALTPLSIIIATLAFLTAFLVNAYNTGKIFGLVVVPQTWLSYVGVAVPFVTSVSGAFASAKALDAVTVFNSIQAGLFALLASAGGAGTHAVLARHVNLASTTKKMMALASKMHGLQIMLVVFGALSLGTFALACQGCQANGQPVPAVSASVDLAVCIFDGYANSPSCRPTGGNWAQCITTIANVCKSDETSVENLIMASKKAAAADLSLDGGK